ncbi:MAG: siderophore-interacting protein [Myxococcota bacterium]
MAKTPRNLTLEKRITLSPHMVRMTLAGEELAGFPAGFEGGYVKLRLEDESVGTAMRTFTIKRFDAERRELDIDMVLHGVSGPAARWAQNVQPGAQVTIMGPGRVKRLNTEADWFLLAGDMTALPAIRVNLAALPSYAEGYAVVEAISKEDQTELEHPPGIELSWVFNPEPTSPNGALPEAVMALPWRTGRASVWVAGEYGAARILRGYLRNDRQVDREDLYVSCYWKAGDTDEGMKVAKRSDAEGW